MPIEYKAFKDTASKTFPWGITALLYLLLGFFVITPERWEFTYSIIYALGFLSVAIVLAAKKPGFLASLMAVFIPGFVIFANLYAFQGSAVGSMWVAVVGFFILLANEYGIIEWKKRTVNMKYLILAPFFFWLIWVVTYFWSCINYQMELPIATILNHGGIAILSLDGILRLLGVIKEKQLWMMWIGLGATIIGALWLTAVLGWGLQLVPV